jgi:S1-C subfamily serine protease
MAEDKKINGHKPEALMQTLGPAGGVGVPELPERAEAAVMAVTGFRAEIPDEAQTAAVLGTEREGNAVIIDDNGLALTIGYLMLECGAIEIADSEGRWVEADFVGYDFETGFGLARAGAPIGIAPARLGTTAAFTQGKQALVAGRGGRARAMAVTIASRRPFAGYWEYQLDNAIFTTPAYPNWSGSALIGNDGKVGGIGSLLVEDAAEQQPSQGNMFVPTDLLSPILDQLITSGRVDRPSRPWLGVFTMDTQGALLVTHVGENSPAARGGVAAGDVVLRVAKHPVADLADFYDRLWSLGEAGVMVPLTIVREGAAVELMLRSEDRYKVFRTPIA